MLQRVRRSPSRGKTTHGGSASSADTAPIELPTPKLSVGKSLPESLRRRETVRAIGGRKLPLQVLSNLLWAACGVNRPKGPFGAQGITAVSASNSQEIDLFVAIDDGVYLFNALDGEGRDAGAHEVLDRCQEHPQMAGILHHHSVPSCILSGATGRSTLVGYAADGYGIYVERNAAGTLLTNTDLDACHGRTSRVLWNGKEQTVYHYDATLEYPYTVGCYHGTPSSSG